MRHTLRKSDHIGSDSNSLKMQHRLRTEYRWNFSHTCAPAATGGFSAVPIFFPFPFFFFFTIFPSAVLTLRTNSLPLFLLPVYTPTQDKPQNLPDAENSCRNPFFPHTSQHRMSVALGELFFVVLAFFGIPERMSKCLINGYEKKIKTIL